jgi:hypothetical protein
VREPRMHCAAVSQPRKFRNCIHELHARVARARCGRRRACVARCVAAAVTIRVRARASRMKAIRGYCPRNLQR